MADGTWLAEAKKNSGLLIFLGVLTVIFGVLAIAAPLITGITVTVFVGFLLVFLGITRIIFAFKSGQWGAGIWGTIIGVVSIIAGLLMVFRPMVGLSSLTLLLAFYFLVDGVFEIIAAFKTRPDQGWGWVLFNGIIAVLLGFMIWRQWPMSGSWAIGVLTGIHILLAGWAMIVLGTGARRVAGAIEDNVGDVADTAGDAAESAADKAKDFAKELADKTEDMADRVGDAAKSAADKTEDFVKDTADKAGDTVDDVFDKAKDTFGRDKD
jgi:uncharacterized membrane protein HdeD (DUF308 family)/ElaB/YqjD/DUF883 family membrane-anchored ribosome-binding protein